MPTIPTLNDAISSVVPGTGAANLGKAEDGAHASGDVGVMALAVRKDTAAALASIDGDYAPLEVDANGRLHVVNSAGVAGTIAHDSTDSGNPIKVGGKASSSLPTAVTNGDRADLDMDRHGAAFVRLQSQPRNNGFTTGHVPAANNRATITQAAAGAGVKNVCTSISAIISSTSTAPTAAQLMVNLIDGASGGLTFLWRGSISIPATAGETRGIVISGLWIPGTANTQMTLEFSAAGGVNTLETVWITGVTVAE